ncbi:DUF4386 family protein [Nocardioides sp. KIGAM211]|uniref:DUF4386 family protein n=1 Tax=Nocardioides luti TaxID=2761101 RepID=A0A7X0VC28_9ACTN|nr:DUF4386 family protein [Nocardioides luti]MBB6628557.1 DUF4386 family protein [Nocardioides luti]
MQKKLDWVPVSAAALVTGAMALTFASLLTPTGSSTRDTLRLVHEQDGRWLVVAVIFFIASVALTVGLPSVLTLFERRGRNLSYLSGLVLAIGFLGTAGYAMLLVFFRALVITGSIRDSGFDEVTHEAGLAVFLYGWIVAFFLGELLLAVALLRARTVPRWIPVVLLVHVLSVFVQKLLPDVVGKATILLFAVGFAGIAMQAVTRDTVRPRP